MVAGYRLTASERLFGVANHVFLTLFALATLYPFWFVLQGSFTDPGFPLPLPVAEGLLLRQLPAGVHGHGDLEGLRDHDRAGGGGGAAGR